MVTRGVENLAEPGRNLGLEGYERANDQGE